MAKFLESREGVINQILVPCRLSRESINPLTNFHSDFKNSLLVIYSNILIPSYTELKRGCLTK